MSSPAWLWLAVPSLVPLALTALNLATWSRGSLSARGSSPAPRVSVLIPARNEIANIENAVRAAFGSTLIPHEVIVYDDQSDDGTRECLDRLAEEYLRLKILDGVALPDGWIGKPHACHRLATAALGDVFVFVDADTQLQPDGLARLTGAMDASLLRPPAQVVSAVPRQRTDTFAEQFILPLLHVTYTSWLWLWIIRATRDPRFLAANGQVLAVTKNAYREMGGFEAVRGEVVDDMAFCQRAKSAGFCVDFLDGFRIATCRMYDSFTSIWNGFSKNMYEGIGGRFYALVLVMVLYLVAFVLPYVLLVTHLGEVTALVRQLSRPELGAVWQYPIAAAALLGTTANVVMRSVLAVRFRQRVTSVVLHPFAVLVMLGILINSFRWTRNNTVKWAGRSYAARSRRLAASQGST